MDFLCMLPMFLPAMWSFCIFASHLLFFFLLLRGDSARLSFTSTSKWSPHDSNGLLENPLCILQHPFGCASEVNKNVLCRTGNQQKIMPESVVITRFDMIPSVDFLTLCARRVSAAEKEADSRLSRTISQAAQGSWSIWLYSPKTEAWIGMLWWPVR
jgi:hypothetical protein